MTQKFSKLWVREETKIKIEELVNLSEEPRKRKITKAQAIEDAVVNMLRQKRGNVQDIFLVAIIAMLIAVVMPVTYKVLSDFKESSADVLSPDAKTNIDNYYDKIPVFFDGLFLVGFVGMFLVVMVSAYYVDVSPFFLVFALIMMGTFIYIAGILANIYFEVASDEAYTTFANNLVVTSYVMQHLVPICTAMATLVFIVLYLKVTNNA